MTDEQTTMAERSRRYHCPCKHAATTGVNRFMTLLSGLSSNAYLLYDRSSAAHYRESANHATTRDTCLRAR